MISVQTFQPYNELNVNTANNVLYLKIEELGLKENTYLFKDQNRRCEDS
jgi:hypothetical protein